LQLLDFFILFVDLCLLFLQHFGDVINGTDGVVHVAALFGFLRLLSEFADEQRQRTQLLVEFDFAQIGFFVVVFETVSERLKLLIGEYFVFLNFGGEGFVEECEVTQSLQRLISLQP
jgi:hypothetical protein